MTISKVIEHEEEIAKGYEEFTAFCINPTANSEIIEYHRQVAEWLRQLKRLEDYLTKGKDDNSLEFWEIRAVLNGEL